MTGPEPGPWKVLSGEGGSSIPFYIIPFDKNGICTGPRTLDHLVGAAGNATDVFLFSHGWNNDWGAATTRYDEFAERFAQVRRQAWSPPTRGYDPVLAGVFWPSTALVAPSEAAPNIAGAPNGQAAPGLPQGLAEVTTLAEDLPPHDAERLYELAQRDRLDRNQAVELAAILAPTLGGRGDELDPDAKPPTSEELMDVWKKLPDEAKTTKAGGFIEDDIAGGPQAAGLLDSLDPRKLVRAATVLLMKDRAGRVGGAGVATMLRRLIDASTTSRLHLIGHSYGCKVVLSALCNGPAQSRKVDSVLLLQPAMSCLCFAGDVDGQGRAGGYRAALDRSRQPIVTTHSDHDFPLTKVFHWAVRRSSDLGEAVIAGAPPSRYAALGGYGPHGAETDTLSMTARVMPHRYDLTGTGKRLVAVDGTEVINGHGDVTNLATAWALLNQVMG